jgi:hypothetical protein
MKKSVLGLMILMLATVQVSAQDQHVFSCEDSDNEDLVTNPSGKTEFTWIRNGEIIFNRVFVDSYSASRNKFVSFYCQNNIIRYLLSDCSDANVAPFCDGNLVNLPPQLDIVQRNVDTGTTLVDSSEYKLLTRYVFTSSTENPVTVTGLAFMNEVDQLEGQSGMESMASEQYEFSLIGPSNELETGVMSEDGLVRFDFSDSPIVVAQNGLNFGIAARPRVALESVGNSSLNMVLAKDVYSKGVEATGATGRLTSREITLLPHLIKIFSRGLSGLKISHYIPENRLTGPVSAPQIFYQVRVENISAINVSQLKRATFDLRLIGLQRLNGDMIQASDFSVVEIAPDASEVGNLSSQVTTIFDNRNDSQSMTIRVDLDNFVVPPNDSRGLGLKISNVENDSVGEDDDDGVAVQMRRERFKSADKLPLSALETADWVWTDFSGGSSTSNRQDWRSGFDLDINYRPVIIRE